MGQIKSLRRGFFATITNQELQTQLSEIKEFSDVTLKKVITENVCQKKRQNDLLATLMARKQNILDQLKSLDTKR